MTGFAGDVASVKLLEANEALAASRFSKSFLARFESLASESVRVPEEASHSEICLPIKEGVYLTLWKLGEMLASGLEVYQEEIPVKQESIEICELLEVNPFEEESSGVIYVLPEGELPLEGKLIGRTRYDNDRVVLMKSGTRYLNKK